MQVLQYFIPFGIFSLMTLLFLRTTKAQKKQELDSWTTELSLAHSFGEGLKTKKISRSLTRIKYLTYMKPFIATQQNLKNCM